jgi:adenylate cyclase
LKNEIERKFLVNAHLLLDVITRLNPNREKITQGYLRDSKPYVRVRQVTNSNDIQFGVITVKGEGTLSRPEVDIEISYGDATDLITMCPQVLRKTRYKIEHGDHVWNVDVFHDRLEGLIVAEVELESEDEELERPVWVTKEVTEDGRYANVSLLKNNERPPTR